MSTTPPQEFGIHVADRNNLGLLRERYRISTGLALVDPGRAERDGFYAPNSGLQEITPLVDAEDPMASLREPTGDELAAIVATPETKKVIQLARLPRKIAEPLLRQCGAIVTVTDEHDRYDLAPGIRGIPLLRRTDAPGQLHVSEDPSEINRFTGEWAKVSEHIDGWKDPETSLLIANMGPGIHWHRLSFEVTRDVLANSGRTQRMKYIQAHPSPQDIPVHWFKLEAPDGEYVEAIINTPVARVLHEGATIGSDEYSEVFSCVVDPMKPGRFKSIL